MAALHSDTPGNGNYVTWRELNLALSPVIKGVEELNQKMDMVLEERAEGKGAQAQKARRKDDLRFLAMILGTLFCGVLGSITVMAFFHHL